MTSVVLLQKEQIPTLRFATTEVLENVVSVLAREKAIERALILGNMEHTKVKITFMDFYHSMYKIETTVWAVTEESICLKGHLYLPKRAVLTVD